MSGGLEETIAAAARATRPEAQGWDNRRPRITATIAVGMIGFIAWAVGVAWAVATGVAIGYPVAVVGLVPVFLILYPLDLYVRGARGERADLFDRAALHLESLGRAVAVARGNAPISPTGPGQGAQ